MDQTCAFYVIYTNKKSFHIFMYIIQSSVHNISLDAEHAGLPSLRLHSGCIYRYIWNITRYRYIRRGEKNDKDEGGRMYSVTTWNRPLVLLMAIVTQKRSTTMFTGAFWWAFTEEEKKYICGEQPNVICCILQVFFCLFLGIYIVFFLFVLCFDTVLWW